MHKEMEKEHVLVFACIASEGLPSNNSGFYWDWEGGGGGGGARPGPMGDAVGGRLFLDTFLSFLILQPL